MNSIHLQLKFQVSQTMIRKQLICILSAISIVFSAQAQQYRALNAQEIYEKLQQLSQLGTVMYLAAHPDDENTRLLSYLVHERHYRTVYLSLTRGDGGQNLIGNELGMELGLIRNYELIAARKIDGAEQAFTSVIDFGFSKDPDETFKFWDKQKLVDEVKSAIKTYRPDVIICRFPTTGEGGHGQHTASAIVAREAFLQLEKEKYPYLAERVLFNAFRFGSRNTTTESQFKIPTNQYNYLLGESYGEMAGRSRSIHRSQGAGTPQSIGINYEYFDIIAGTKLQDRLIDKDLSWNRIQKPEIGKAIEKVIREYSFTNPAAVLPQLLEIRKEIVKIDAKDEFWKEQKLKEIDRIILSAAGFMGEMTTNVAEVTPGSKIPLSVNLITRVPGVRIAQIEFPGNTEPGISGNTLLRDDTAFTQDVTLQLSGGRTFTQPYWLKGRNTTAWYDNPDGYHWPETPNDFVALVSLDFSGQRIVAPVPISYKYLSPTKGDVVQGLRIIPEFFIRTEQSLMFAEKEGKLQVPIRVQSNVDQAGQGRLTISRMDSKGNHIIYDTMITLPSLGKDSLYTIEMDALEITRPEEIWLATIQWENKEFSKEQRIIHYDHLPELVYYKDASVKVVRKDWTGSRKKIGYIQGAGDQVFETLKNLGLNVTVIPDALLSNADYLKQYDVLIAGVRAYNTNASLVSNKDHILAFIREGGNFIVQYNTNMNLLTADIGPYPFTLSRDRVTDETAEITIRNTHDPLLQIPNKISQNDFAGWVQERGLYFAETIDPRYTTILEMNDPGEPALENATFYSRYGEGSFIYTSLSFFRQLPAGNPGAIKLWMNMIELK